MPKAGAILSIQSEVVYGHVGNGAARFALNRLGFEVWALPTTQLSNHPGYAKFRGEMTPAATLRALLEGLAENDWLPQCAAVLSGYLGQAEHADIVADAVQRVKQANPQALYLCDPVFGDDDGAYAKPGVAEAMARRLLPLADIVTPNRFELASLTARQVTDADEAVAAARSLGRREVLVTSVPFAEGEIGSVIVDRTGASATKAKRLDSAPHGTGDLLSALYLAWRLRAKTPVEALELATSATHDVILASVAAQSTELELIAAQDVLLTPRQRLTASPLVHRTVRGP
jgi:pyridoxine kinase